ncbi:MAG: 2-isopropylmalate synthase [SAR202 cluster bacterium]|nr:2-isopropylmalate synthase [SAR202 cluster bacterium]
MSKEKVLIFDTTLRDGEQSAGAGLTVNEKLEIANQLNLLGVDIIEAGFAASSEGDFDAVKKISNSLSGTTKVASLARCNPEDIKKAGEALEKAKNPRIHVFISSSDVQIWHQLRKNPEEVLEMAVSSVEFAKQYCDDVEFSPMDATRTDREYLYKILHAVISSGANTVNIPDTVGFSVPSEFGNLIKSITQNVDNISQAIISVHCHNDLGNASANSIAAVQNGARQIEGCINGLGERAGNASLEEVIMNIETRKQFLGVTTNVDTRQIYRTSKMVSDIFGFQVQANKAIVGANAFRHASGIHQDGVIKNRDTFEIMDPKSIGWTNNSLVMGKLSGRAGLKSKLEELGFKLSKEELDSAFKSFKDLADRKKIITDADLENLMSSQRRTNNDNDSFKLEEMHVSSSTTDTPWATVTLSTPDGTKIKQNSTGTGPVDAAYKAINKIISAPSTLTEFKIDSVTKGIDAIGDVTVRVEENDQGYLGRGSDTDIIIASAKAYINALNRMLSMKQYEQSNISSGS